MTTTTRDRCGPTIGEGRHRRRVARGCERRGAALVEFAMVAPVFFLFLVGAVEFGRAIMVQEALTNASREGARVATLDGSLDSDVSNAANDYLNCMGIAGATVTPSPHNPGLTSAGTEVSVTVSIPYMSVTWVPSPWFLKGATLTASTTMQRETTQ